MLNVEPIEIVRKIRNVSHSNVGPLINAVRIGTVQTVNFVTRDSVHVYRFPIVLKMMIVPMMNAVTRASANQFPVDRIRIVMAVEPVLLVVVYPHSSAKMTEIVRYLN